MITFLSICVYLLLATTLYAWHHILEQRRVIATLRESPKEQVTFGEAEKALKAHMEAPAESEKTKPFPLNGIGPTAIRDRELRREQDEKERTTPEMIVMRPPTEAEIAEATKKILREQGQLN